MPRPLFDAPLSTQLLSAEGELLSARIAADGQWRMPAADSVSSRLKAAVLVYEDRRFRQHWGVSLSGIGRAIRDNWQAGAVVSGGSTITMQVARMARGNKSRTLGQKVMEALWATRMEWRYDKDEILAFWLANAPFGGNVVGAEAAARRYYGRSPEELSWAEAATLAVLPNSPALIHPGRARDALRDKRDRLLDQLAAAGHCSSEEVGLARLEPLPERPHPLPREAGHLLERLRSDKGAGRYRSSLNAALQRRVAGMVREHHLALAGNGIHNAAAMVTEVSSGRVVAYVGNVPDLAPAFAPDVDVITSPRSPGSLLKPMLYALAQEEGRISSKQLLPDVPTSFGDFRPANFYRDYDGAVPADEALARSLNIPFVYLLQDYGTERFHAALREYGFKQLLRGPDHYGLSLVLGGGEITMEEINAWFLGMARQQRYFYERQGWYAEADFQPATLLDAESRDPLADLNQVAGAVGAGAGFKTLEALTALNRPDETGASHRFSSHQKVAWKTGTSFGFRDAWAVGCTPAYVVSVWTGNADGEGRAGLVGVRAAAPLLFRILRALEQDGGEAPRWFEAPYDDMTEATVCQTSGYLAGPDCPTTAEWQAANAERASVCRFHQRIFTTPEGDYRVNQDCAPGQLVTGRQFQLPSRQAYFYRRRHPEYRSLIPWHPDCANAADAGSPMQFIYPHGNGAISAGKNWHGEIEPVFFELSHQKEESTVHWHIDGEFMGSTTRFHSLAVEITEGRHTITVVDEDGARLERRFVVR
ncbi:penicillin-binding protein 1C [Neolewinella agarilytica]|uniref:peptidoglycan glycosyltransferase n=1 Tax=Neolewinella agarilytica TaxID=478744 RepID=A0A1H9CTF3_9BACT|nr:penicillin-binding protein 1C [Neolewinella agarilytica]SEQ04500.1 penicillin-binding protein 1C [Neolewinella agarilytica]